MNRYKLNDIAANNTGMQQLLFTMCEKDIVYFTNNFVWTYDPRCPTPYLPMHLFPIQEELLRWLQFCEQNQYHSVIEKSRDMGVTWLSCVDAVHSWLFAPASAIGFGSRKEELVDKADDPKCIFHKVRTIIEKLPPWMLPAGFIMDKHSNHMLITNPENDSVIAGEAGNNMGRGGRTSKYNVDEHAFIEHAQTVDAALSNNTNVIRYFSTPNGATVFSQKCRAARKDPEGPLRVFRMHWMDDPRKNHSEIVEDKRTGEKKLVYPWYEKQKAVINNPVVIAQELDIAHDASIEGILIPAKYVHAAINFAEYYESRTGNTIDLSAELHMAGVDIAGEGDANSVFAARRGPVIYDIQAWLRCDIIKAADRIISMANSRNVDFLVYDGDGIGISVGSSLKQRGQNIKFEFTGFRAGGRCSNRKWVDGVGADGQIRYKLSKYKFKNPRAEQYWILRERFEKTYEYRELGVMHPITDLISIPDHLELVRQLSDILCHTGDDGLIRLESKEDMRDRGADSPDFADALMLSFVTRGINKSTETHRENYDEGSYWNA